MSEDETGLQSLTDAVYPQHCQREAGLACRDSKLHRAGESGSSLGATARALHDGRELAGWPAWVDASRSGPKAHHGRHTSSRDLYYLPDALEQKGMQGSVMPTEFFFTGNGWLWRCLLIPSLPQLSPAQHAPQH